MDWMRDFIAGRSNKLARDFLMTSIVITGVAMAGFAGVKYMLNEVRLAQSDRLPPRIAGSSGPTTTMTITRSVLDDVVTTGSINGRSIVIDPCTGKEKK